MTTPAERLEDFALARGNPYPATLEGMNQAMRDWERVYGHLPVPTPPARDARVRVRESGREATVMLVRANGDVTVRYDDDRTCETMRASAMEVV